MALFETAGIGEINFLNLTYHLAVCVLNPILFIVSYLLMRRFPRFCCESFTVHHNTPQSTPTAHLLTLNCRSRLARYYC